MKTKKNNKSDKKKVLGDKLSMQIQFKKKKKAKNKQKIEKVPNLMSTKSEHISHANSKLKRPNTSNTANENQAVVLSKKRKKKKHKKAVTLQTHGKSSTHTKKTKTLDNIKKHKPPKINTFVNEVNDSGNNSPTTFKEKEVPSTKTTKRQCSFGDGPRPLKKKAINEVTEKSKKLIMKEKLQSKLKTLIENVNSNSPDKTKKKQLSLRERMLERLKAAKFRYLNEQIYTREGADSEKAFKEDPGLFKAYHEGYQQQVKKWPINPVSIIIKSIQKMPKTYVVADLGCGDAVLSKSVEQTVHSFDLVAVNDSVTACDMAHLPLKKQSIDIVVFCLSLMGTNLQDYLYEANRILKIGGLLKIAEVESRFDDVDNFIQGIERLGFKNTWKDLSHNLFYFLDFKKINVKNKKKPVKISLQPCIYKKR